MALPPGISIARCAKPVPGRELSAIEFVSDMEESAVLIFLQEIQNAGFMRRIGDAEIKMVGRPP